MNTNDQLKAATALMQLVFGADGHGIQAPEVILYRFVHNATGSQVGASVEQSVLRVRPWH